MDPTVGFTTADPTEKRDHKSFRPGCDGYEEFVVDGCACHAETTATAGEAASPIHRDSECYEHVESRCVEIGACKFEDECVFCGGYGIPAGKCDCYGDFVDCFCACGGDTALD